VSQPERITEVKGLAGVADQTRRLCDQAEQAMDQLPGDLRDKEILYHPDALEVFNLVIEELEGYPSESADAAYTAVEGKAIAEGAGGEELIRRCMDAAAAAEDRAGEQTADLHDALVNLTEQIEGADFSDMS
jgi:hypothetical protein